MPQDNSTFNIHKISEQSLDYLASNKIGFSRLSTNITGGVKEKGETVSVRLSGSLVAGDKTAGTKTAKQDANYEKVTVTLNRWKSVKIGENDLERTLKGVGDFESDHIASAFEALNEAVMTDVLSLATAANGFDTFQTVSAANAVTADTMANIRRKLSENKVPSSNRLGILSPEIIESLQTDGAIQNTAAFGNSTAVQDGKVERLSGISCFEYNGNIPSNSENMVGIVAHPQAFAVAMRETAMPEAGTWAGQAISRVDPVSGLPFQIRRYYDMEDEEQVIEWSVFYGVAVGQSKAAIRVVSA